MPESVLFIYIRLILKAHCARVVGIIFDQLSFKGQSEKRKISQRANENSKRLKSGKVAIGGSLVSDWWRVLRALS